MDNPGECGEKKIESVQFQTSWNHHILPYSFPGTGWILIQTKE
jgi:hypothetical protein